MGRNTEQILAEAQGWLELGKPAEALKVLERVPSSSVDLAMLSVRYHAFAAAEQWAMANMVADAASHLYPKEVEPWLWRAEVAQNLEGAATARTQLLIASKIFPGNDLIAQALERCV